MSEHFTDGQIAEWVAGERVPERESHLQNCPACRSHVENFQAALTGFGASMRAWSEMQYVAATEASVKARSSERPVVVRGSLYAAAGLAAVCLVAVLVMFHGALVRQSAPVDTRASLADAALLRQIDTEVSQTVPHAMEPLTELVSWDSPAEEGSQSKQTQKRAE
jgi:predicted anti-sigma-YlaC factor YlaD